MLLSEQTSVILKATDQKIDGVKKDMELLLADQANAGTRVAAVLILRTLRKANPRVPEEMRASSVEKTG